MQRAAEESGEKPVDIPLKPELADWLEPVAEAFFILSCSRPASLGGLLPIPVSEVLYYWTHFPWLDKDEFLFLIQQADLHWLKLAEEDAPKDGRRNNP